MKNCFFMFLLYTGATAGMISCNNKLKAPPHPSLVERENKNQQLWEDADAKSVKIIGEHVPLPKLFRTLKLNTTLMKEKLSNVMVTKGDSTKKQEIIEIPLPEGGFVKYEITETQTMDVALLEKFPQLRTYSGQGVGEPTSTAKIDFMPSGFHGYLFTLKGSVIIDPAATGDTLYYICYYKQDSNEFKKEFEFNSDSIK